MSPDFAGHTSSPTTGCRRRRAPDGALALAMAHVILREFYVERRTPYFDEYARRTTDMPFLVTSASAATATWPTASCAPRTSARRARTPSGRRWCSTRRRASPPCPTDRSASAGARRGGRWNLDMGGVTPALEILGRHDELVPLDMARFDVPGTEGGAAHRRGVAARRVGGMLVTTVFELLAAQLGVRRGDDLPGDWPAGLDDPAAARRRGRSDHRRGRRHGGAGGARVRPQRRALARALDDHDGGGHQPLVPLRPDLPGDADPGAPVRLPGVNGGGWAHYVGQEKVRPITGWSTLAFGLDWSRPPAPAGDDPLLVPDERPVALPADARRRVRLAPRGRRAAGHAPGRHLRARRPARLDAVLPELRPQPARPRRRRLGRGDARGRLRAARARRGPAAASPPRTPTGPATSPRC